MTENRVRSILRKQNVVLRKDRARKESVHHQGGYMIIEFLGYEGTPFIAAGSDYDLSLEDIVELYGLK